jgi:hypothetical protein
MKGDFSRYTFDPAKHYTAVLEQQGRVQLDADANEQRAIDAHRLETETIDVIGVTGAPVHNAGFAFSLRADNASLLIGPGRYYVNGLLCEEATQTDYLRQPGLIAPQPGIGAMLNDLRTGRASAIQLWLEVWQRMATPIDDPCLKDPALGEADTTVRVQTVWRVVADAIAATTTGQAGLTNAVQGLRQSIAAYQQLTRSTALDSLAAQADRLSAEAAGGTVSDTHLAAALAALHAEATAAVSKLVRLPADTATRLAASLDALAGFGVGSFQSDCCAAMHRRLLLRLRPGEMTATTDDTTDQGPCLPSPQAAYRGLENQLYRIEVHQGGTLAEATFKWSRDNGSVVTRITNISGKVVTVDSLGPDANLGFASLQWVELTDDSDEFGAMPNQPGQLRQIQFVDFAHNRITLTDTAPLVDYTNGHAKLRRWDHTDVNATQAGIPMAPGGWHRLENGIQVQFSDARPFVPGDFWQVPARTATGALEWPPCASDGADYQPARNTRIFRAPLACIDWEPKQGGFVPHDCRDMFYPLTELTPPPAQSALHVTAINWVNDDVRTLDHLFASGLSVTLDAAPTSGIDPARFIVSLEYPVSLDQFTAETNARQRFVPGVLRNEIFLDGSVTVNGNTLVWGLPRNLYFFLVQNLESLDGFADLQQYIRARVLLKGRTIWGSGAGTIPYLDGQCFGLAATRANSQTPRTDLAFPSGASATASDFESWFDLAPLPRVASLTATPPAVAWVPIAGNALLLHLVDAANPSTVATPVLNLALNYNAIADTQVAISITDGTPGNVTVQSPITIPRGATSLAQPIPISVGNPGAVKETYKISAAVVLPSGVQFPMETTFTVTGHARPVRRTGITNNLPGGRSTTRRSTEG